VATVQNILIMNWCLLSDCLKQVEFVDPKHHINDN